MRRCRMDELESLHFICCLSLDLHGRGLLGFDQGSSNRSWLRVRRHDLESVETYSRAHTAKSVQDTFAGGTFVVHEDEGVPGLLLHIEEQFDRIRKALSSLLEHYGKLLPSRIAATRIQLTSQAATVQSATKRTASNSELEGQILSEGISQAAVMQVPMKKPNCRKGPMELGAGCIQYKSWPMHLDPLNIPPPKLDPSQKFSVTLG